MPPGKGTPLRGAIVAMTHDRVIGLDNGIPWHYPEDLRRFKQRTINSIIVMGRITWESIGRQPLVNRRNIVISRHRIENAEWYPDPDSALTQCESEDTWIIGGAQIYQATMDWITLLDITLVPNRIESDQAVCFPEIDEKLWQLQSETMLEHSQLENRIYSKITR
ncbi:MAG: dihydrofolate reductase [Gammaproteobacteria bacterium]|nr:dihydrofolate reductase [Gammaproteobacteria bacterium]MCY4228284.1 dihydrofolate reductase [Gammaproteobacteria bacterium]